MKLSKSLAEGICPPTRQGDRVQPATGVLYHRGVAMSTKTWRELLGGGESRLGGGEGKVGGRGDQANRGDGVFSAGVQRRRRGSG